MMNTKRLFDNNYVLFFLSFIVLSILNFSVYGEYGFSDEYSFIWQGSYQEGEHETWVNGFIMQGRMLIAWSNDFLYPLFVNKISSLTYLRIISLIFYSILLVKIYWFLVKQLKWSKINAYFIALAFISVPGITVHIGWGTTFSYSIAEFLSFTGGLILLNESIKGKISWVNLSKSAMLLVLSLSIYQASFTMAFLPIGLYFITFKIKNMRAIILFSIGIAFSIILYFIFWKVSIYVYGLNEASRSGMNLSELPRKILFFYNTTMKDIYPTSFIVFERNLLFSLGIVLFVLSTIYFVYRVIKKELSIYNLFFLFLIFPGSYIINLVLDEYFLCSRTMQTTVILTLFFQLQFFLWIKKYSLKYFWCLCIPFVLVSFYNQNIAFAGLQIDELKLFKKITFREIRDINLVKKKVVLIRPGRDLCGKMKLVNYPYSDEFGLFSASVEWAIPNMFRLVLLESGEYTIKELSEIKLESTDSNYKKVEGDFLINYEELYKSEW